MARKSHKRQYSSTGVARHTSVARPRSATSRVWDDLPQSHPRAQSVVSVAHRANQARKRLGGVAKAPIRPFAAFSFGPWGLPTLKAGNLSVPWSDIVRNIETRTKLIVRNRKLLRDCVGRHRRREVLFATRQTGAGSHGRRLHFTNTRC